MKTLTRETYAKRIERVLSYIINHLDEPLDIHRLAEEAFLSPYHFHRVYVAMLGETVTETIRRHRLHRAAIKLTASATPVTTLAREAGYASVQAFTRAFHEGYGLPPGKFRLHGELSASLTKIAKQTRKEHPMFKLADVNIQTLPPMRVAALRHRGDYQQIGATFGALMAWAAGKNVLKMDVRTFGVYYDDPQSKPKAELLSEACVEIPREFALAAGSGDDVRALNLAHGRAAVFVYTGPYSELENPYRWLFDTWLRQSGEELRDEPCFEEYLNDARNTPPSDLKTAICIPLKG
jgi:AraC family transcriptional regulator